MKNREYSDQSKKCLPYPIYCSFTQSDHCANTAVVNTSQQFTFLEGSSGLALCWNGNSWWCSGGTSCSAVALFVPWPLWPSSSKLPSFSHLPVHIRKSVTSPRIAFSHLSLVVSIGVLPPEHPFITFWGYTSHLSLSAHASLEELAIINFKHHKWNTSIIIIPVYKMAWHVWQTEIFS